MSSAPRSPTPVVKTFRTFGCKVCNTQVTTTKHILHCVHPSNAVCSALNTNRAFQDVVGFNGPAMLVRHVSDAAAANNPRKPLEMDGGWYTVRAMVCRSCGGYLGWSIQDERDHVEAKRRRSAERQYAQVRLEPLRRKESFSSCLYDSSSNSTSSSDGTRSRSSSLSSWRIRPPRRCPWQLLSDVVKSRQTTT